MKNDFNFERGKAKAFAADFVDNGFEQFATLPKPFPFREDVEESFGSLYMVVRDLIMYIQEGGSISIPEMNKVAKEWNKCSEIRSLVELVNDQELVENWEDQITSSYGNILMFITIFQQMFEEKYNKDE